MKTLILALAALILATTVHAADLIVLNDDGTVTRNGVSLNNVWDALLNKQITNAECAAAWRAKLAALTTREAAASKAMADHKAIVEAVAKDDKTALATAVKSDKDRRKAEIQARIDAAKKELEDAK